ncbi:unnamed protein product, partial [Nesidiocoris tenuis]
MYMGGNGRGICAEGREFGESLFSLRCPPLGRLDFATLGRRFLKHCCTSREGGTWGSHCGWTSIQLGFIPYIKILECKGGCGGGKGHSRPAFSRVMKATFSTPVLYAYAYDSYAHSAVSLGLHSASRRNGFHECPSQVLLATFSQSYQFSRNIHNRSADGTSTNHNNAFAHLLHQQSD